MGARLRLKTNVGGQDPASRTADPNVRKIFRAMQRYGLIVADNGSDMYITGTFDTRWNNDILNPAFSLLTASDFEVIQLGWNSPAGATALGSLSASPNPIVGGNPSTGTVTLTSTAPAGGAVVSLSSASTAVVVPGSITVNQGASSATFGITTSSVATQTLTTLSASYNGITKTTTFTVNPAPSAALATLTVSPTAVVGGTSATGTVTLTAPAPGGGAVVMLASSKPSLASVPASVTVAAGSTSANFSVTTSTTKRNTSATLSAAYSGATKTATITVKRR
jgi:hypothetical protein